jgi:SpoIIAA-like
VAYQIAFERAMIVLRLSGTVTAADLEALAAEVLGIEQGGANTPPRLIDLRDGTDTAVGYVDVARLADAIRTRPLTARLRSALLVSHPLQLGFARMFQTLNQHPLITVRIFEDEAAAREWLAGNPNEP